MRYFPILFCMSLLLFFNGAAQAAMLEQITARDELVAGVKDMQAPFGYLDEKTNTLTGFDVDICRHIAKELGVDLRLKAVSTADRVPMLAQGAVDMIAAGMPHSMARDEVIDFSITYFRQGVQLLVPQDSPLQSLKDLGKKKVGIVRNERAEKDIKLAQPSCEVISYVNSPLAFLGLKAGEVDALAANTTVLQGLRNVDDKPEDWKIVGAPFAVEEYGLGVPENQSDFRDAVNQILIDMWKSGEFQKTYNSWFGPNTPYALPLDWTMKTWR